MAVKNARVAALIAAQDYVVGRQQLLSGGTTRHAIENCFEYDGWQRLLPEVYLALPGEPSRRQLLVAALLYAGDEAAIDADDALRFHGLAAADPDPERVHVVVPELSRARTRGFVRVRRTRAPLRVVRTGLLRYADPASALIAAARLRSSDRAVLALISEAVQRRIVSVDEILRAHVQGPPKHAAHTDRALREVVAGVRSVPEADFRVLAEASTVLPPLRYNALLRLPSGRLVSPDALAVDAGLVHESNGRRAHARLDLFEDMQERHDAMTEAGLVVLHNPPRRIRCEGRAVIAQFERLYLRHVGRGLPAGVELIAAQTASGRSERQWG